jgi:succinoglycan biosynthesis protein ExoA
VSDWRSDPRWPDVDVVMPIRNEAPHLADALAAIRAQDYPGFVSIYMAIGPSDDGTEDVAAQLAAADENTTVIPNPTGRTPAGLNIAISSGTAPVVVRVDGHSKLSDGYITRAVETMRRTGAANVGGMQSPVAATRFEIAVAVATSSWLGTGGPAYRTGGEEASVDTVYLGVFDRRCIEGVGLFDERLTRNQDYELNIRLRASGGTVLFDPQLSVGYTPRGTWRSLTKQYFEYGYWKAEVLRLHPGSLKFRQLVPPVAVVTVVVAGTIGLRQRSALAIPAAYAAAVLSVVSNASRWRTAGVLWTIHATWTAGFFCSLVRRRRPPVR